MTWNDSLSIGNLEIDEQHKLFCEYLDHVITACSHGKCRSEIEHTIQFLEFYAQSHFTSEENWMAKIGYPQMQQHQDMHKKFFSRVQELKKDLYASGETIVLVGKINLLLYDWLITHIKEMDAELVAWQPKEV